MTIFLGISAFYHDSAAAIIKDGEILSAVQEERLSRVKHDSNFPSRAIKSILSSNNLSLKDINKVIFYDKPFLKFDRLLETYIANAPFGFKSFAQAMPIWLREKLFLKNLLVNKLKQIDKNFSKNKIFFQSII